MKLYAMADAMREWIGQTKGKDLTPTDLVGLLTDAEWTHRENKKLTARLRNARFRHQASVEDRAADTDCGPVSVLHQVPAGRTVEKEGSPPYRDRIPSPSASSAWTTRSRASRVTWTPSMRPRTMPAALHDPTPRRGHRRGGCRGVAQCSSGGGKGSPPARVRFRSGAHGGPPGSIWLRHGR